MTVHLEALSPFPFSHREFAMMALVDSVQETRHISILRNNH